MKIFPKFFEKKTEKLFVNCIEMFSKYFFLNYFNISKVYLIFLKILEKFSIGFEKKNAKIFIENFFHRTQKKNSKSFFFFGKMLHWELFLKKFLKCVCFFSIFLSRIIFWVFPKFFQKYFSNFFKKCLQILFKESFRKYFF